MNYKKNSRNKVKHQMYCRHLKIIIFIFHLYLPNGFLSTYVEDESFYIPSIVDSGLSQLGDLWDCQTSRALHVNIFAKEIDQDHIEVAPIQNQEYSLSHIRSSRDKLKAIGVNAEMSLELLGGLIKIEGALSFESTESSKMLSEKLALCFKLQTSLVGFRLSAKEKFDQMVLDKLTSGELRATHIVNKIKLGADVNALIEVKIFDELSKTDLSGILLNV